MSAKNLISANNISVIREGNVILDNIDLAINEEDFITIIGPNGAGKSVLLSCLMGIATPTKGEVVRQSNVSIGYVPQSFHADASLPISVKRFLTLRQKSLSAKQIKNHPDYFNEVVNKTNIHAILDTPLNVLSGGEMQRVLVARALMKKPKLLILDEPAQNLDVTGQLEFYALIDQLHKEKHMSVIMVSHELHLVMASTQKVICLYKHICCSGEPQMVMKDPEFISLFGNDMAKMMAVYQHEHDHNHDHSHEHGHDNCNDHEHKHH